MQASEPEPEARRRRAVVILLVLGLGAGSLGLFLLSWGASASSGPEFLQVSLQSLLEANYFADLSPARVSAVDPGLIEDVIRDQREGAADLPERLATLEAVLQSSVPTVTPLPTAAPDTPAAAGTAAPTGQNAGLPAPPPSGTPAPGMTSTLATGPAYSATPGPLTPESTSTRTPTAAASRTLTPTATDRGPSLPTATRTSLATSTRTSVPTSTPTPVPTRTPPPAPTSTPVPTRTPTSTKAPVPSNTPTLTPTPSPTPPLSLMADLSVSMEDQPDPVKPGDKLIYRIGVTNNGPADATGVEMVDDLPAQVDFVKVSGGNCEESAGVVTCDIGNFSDGNSAEFVIEVKVHSDATGVLTNVASVSSQSPDDNTGNNSATAKTTVK